MRHKKDVGKEESLHTFKERAQALVGAVETEVNLRIGRDNVNPRAVLGSG